MKEGVRVFYLKIMFDSSCEVLCEMVCVCVYVCVHRHGW